MDSKKAARLKLMHQALQDQHAIHLREMAQLLGVSEMTLRRDLRLPPDGLRLLGGHVTRDIGGSEAPGYQVVEQDLRQVEEKRRIGRLAAAQIRAGDTVFLDCGTTTPFVVDFIPDDLEFTAVCHSLNVLLKLQQKANCTLVVCGGTFQRKNQIFESRLETGVLDGVRLTHAFVSAAGVSGDFGVTCFNFNEVEVKQKVLRQAQQRLLLVDHTKFDVVRAAHFAALDDFDLVVSDGRIPRSYRERIEANGAQLLT